MAEKELVANFNGIDGFRTTIFDAQAVPEELWHQLQSVQRDSIRSMLPRSEWQRADALVRWGDSEAYIETRVDPNLLVGNGWNDNQLFRRTLVAVIFDLSNQPVAGVLTANNSSASKKTPDVLKPVVYWAKILAPPGRKVPIIGGKSHVHLREGYAHPDAQEALADENTEVSGLVLAGLYHSLGERHQDQTLALYTVPGDPADQDMVDMARFLDMRRTNEAANKLPGYSRETKVVRVAAKVGHVMDTILYTVGAHYSLNTTRPRRFTNRDARYAKSQEKRLLEKADRQRFYSEREDMGK